MFRIDWHGTVFVLCMMFLALQVVGCWHEIMNGSVTRNTENILWLELVLLLAPVLAMGVVSTLPNIRNMLLATVLGTLPVIMVLVIGAHVPSCLKQMSCIPRPAQHTLEVTNHE